MMYGYGGYGPGMMDGWGGGWLGMGLMMLFGWMVVVGIVLLIIWLVRGGTQGRAPGHGGMMMGHGEDNALTIARERLARGEITPEEYEQLRATLMRQ